MKKYYLLTGLLLVMTALTSRAQSYNINNGSLSFIQNGSGLEVTQGAMPPDTYPSYFNTTPNILIYGNGNATTHTISFQATGEPVITLSNVVIQTSTETPILLTGGGTRILLFLATGTTNQLKTTAQPIPYIEDFFHPAIHVRGDNTQKLTITGTGTLIVEGGESSAGIGSDYYGAAGEITIGGSATVIATGGMGAAGIGGGEGTAGGFITILSNANVIATGGAPGVNVYDETLGGAAGIGGGAPNETTEVSGGAGGTITLSDNARVTAYAGVGASAIGSGASATSLGNISIGVSNKVFALSDGTRSAIDDTSLGGNGYVMLLNFYTPRTAGTTNTLCSQYWTALTNAIIPVAYQSLAFSVAQMNTYRIKCNDIPQKHGNTNINFSVTTTGLTPFLNVADTNVVIQTHTQTTPVAVPYEWLSQHYPLYTGDYEILAMGLGANGFTNWQSYVAGLLPTNAQSLFMASISITNSTPYITWAPNLAERIYTVQGKTNLAASSWGNTNSATRFFKVSVDLP